MSQTQTQPDKSARSKTFSRNRFTKGNSSDSESDSNLQSNTSFYDRLKKKFEKHLHLHRNPSGCVAGAVLYRQDRTNLIMLKQALFEKEVRFYKGPNKKINDTTLRSAIDEGLGNMSFEIQWAQNTPKWQ